MSKGKNTPTQISNVCMSPNILNGKSSHGIIFPKSKGPPSLNGLSPIFHL